MEQKIEEMSDKQLVSKAMKLLNMRRNEKYGPEWRKENAIRAINKRWENYKLRKIEFAKKIIAERKALEERGE